MSFDLLAEVCEKVAASPGRNRKIEWVAGFLAQLDEADLERAVRFLQAEPIVGGERPALGYATLREAIAEVTGWDRGSAFAKWEIPRKPLRSCWPARRAMSRSRWRVRIKSISGSLLRAGGRTE